jgi:hypothetical protein
VLQLLVTANVPSTMILVTLIWRRYVPRKRRFLQEPHGITSQKNSILHSHRRENLKSYITLTYWTLYRRRNVFPVRYELGVFNPEGGSLYSRRRESLKSYTEY